MRSIRIVSAALGLAVLSSGCASGGDAPIQIGSKHVAVDLAFKDDAKADAPKPPILVEVPAFNPTDTFGLPRVIAAPGKPAPTVDCAVAPPGAPAEEVAPITITEPPRAGVYPALLKGHFDIVLGETHQPFDVTTKTTVTYANVKTNGTGADKTFSYDVIVKLADTTTTTSFLIRPASLDVQFVRQVSVTGPETRTFEPLAPMTWYQMKGVGSGPGGSGQWSSAGSDPAGTRVLTLEGSNVERERVDVCGTVHESFRVFQREHARALGTSDGVSSYDTTEPDPGSPNVYNVATQLGGLILRTQYHYTQSGTGFGADGKAVAVTANVDATLALLSTSPRSGSGA
jgi:hypothetical protein